MGLADGAAWEKEHAASIKADALRRENPCRDLPKTRELLKLRVMLQHDTYTIADEFNGNMAIHSPCGNGVILLTKQQAMEFFDLVPTNCAD